VQGLLGKPQSHGGAPTVDSAAGFTATIELPAA